MPKRNGRHLRTKHRSQSSFLLLSIPQAQRRVMLTGSKIEQNIRRAKDYRRVAKPRVCPGGALAEASLGGSLPPPAPCAIAPTPQVNGVGPLGLVHWAACWLWWNVGSGWLHPAPWTLLLLS